MTSPTSSWQGKLSQGLQTPDASEAEALSVIIEVDVPHPKIDVRPSRNWRRTRSKGSPKGTYNEAEAHRRINAVNELVKRVSHGSTVVLAGAAAVVAKLNPSQIESVAKSPLVRMIMPNRRHRL